jgi:hypothetical protein
MVWRDSRLFDPSNKAAIEGCSACELCRDDGDRQSVEHRADDESKEDIPVHTSPQIREFEEVRE